MYLIQSWKDSFRLLEPKNFKLFAMVTARTIGQTYGLLFRYFWWFPVLGGVDYFFSLTVVDMIIIIGIFWSILAVLTARPSVAIKNYNYFGQYILYAPLLVLAFLFWFLFLVYTLVARIGPPMSEPPLTKVIAADFITYLFVAQLFLFMFFLFDMAVGIFNFAKAVVFSWKMLIYNLPLYTLFACALIGVSYLWKIVIAETILAYLYIPIELSDRIEWLFFIPIIASIISNFYIKRLHEQPQLFFKQSKE